jgi:hypothetical protein
MKTKTILFSFLFFFLSCAAEKGKQLNSIRNIKVEQKSAGFYRHRMKYSIPPKPPKLSGERRKLSGMKYQLVPKWKYGYMGIRIA